MAEESYAWRFWKRFFKDATWARDNILWGFLVVAIPTGLVYFRNHSAQIDWPVLKNTTALYALALLVYVFVHLCRTPGRLDADRATAERALAATIAERDQTIARLTAKPARTAAEQHHYDVAKRTLERYGPNAEIALRYLKSQGSVNFGTYNPPFLPSGLNAAEAIRLYNACAGEGVVICRENQPRMGERTFEIAPTMNKALDELLYPLTLYAAARCQINPEHIIRLAVIKPGHEGWAVEPFDAYCEACKMSQQFSRHQVIHWQGPAPSNTFQTHPSFR